MKAFKRTGQGYGKWAARASFVSEKCLCCVCVCACICICALCVRACGLNFGVQMEILCYSNKRVPDRISAELLAAAELSRTKRVPSEHQKDQQRRTRPGTWRRWGDRAPAKSNSLLSGMSESLRAAKIFLGVTQATKWRALSVSSRTKKRHTDYLLGIQTAGPIPYHLSTIRLFVVSFCVVKSCAFKYIRLRLLYTLSNLMLAHSAHGSMAW